MATAFLRWPMIFAAFSLTVFLGFYVYFKFFTSKFWARKNIPHLKPVFLLGNVWRANILESMNDVLARIYSEQKKNKAIGLWTFNQPQLMVMDVELAKKILIKDFHIFRDRGIEIDTKLDPLNGHLFMMKGKAWRNLRVKLTPTFTSGKMKMMFPNIMKCGEQLEKHLMKMADRREIVEIKDLMSRFNTDIIGSCAFGIETNAVDDPHSDFLHYGKKFLEPGLRTAIVSTFLFFLPGVNKALKIRVIPKDVTEFFMSVVKNTIEYREKNRLTRNDFLQMIIQLIRAGKVEDVDKNPIDDQGLDDEALVQKFSLTEAAAQCFVFFAAGFETSSSAMAFSLYELAVNPDIQKRLQKEIDESTKNEITYETLTKMEYLDMVIQETLRKYPPVGLLQRVSNADYYIPELGATIDKGTGIILPVQGFQHDPDFFPEPEKFDPERFSAENKSQIDFRAFLVFGDGPRSCIGNRFALMQFKTALIYILKSFNVEVTEKTPIPLKLSAMGFSPISFLPLAFTRRR